MRTARVKERLDGYLQEVLAVDRAQRLPDAYWLRLAERLEADLDVGWSLLAHGDPDDGVVSGSRLGQALAAWQRAAAAWGTSGAAPAARAPTSPRGELGRLTFPDVTAPGERALFVTEIVTRVEIVQAPDGTVSGWRVVGRSGNRAHDDLVVERVKALAEERDGPGPTPEQGRRTTWAVRTRFEMLPPVPLVGCSFDATFRPAGCFYPLKRMVKTRVRLERVWTR